MQMVSWLGTSNNTLLNGRFLFVPFAHGDADGLAAEESLRT